MVYHTKSTQKPSLKKGSPLRYGEIRSQAMMNITQLNSIIVVIWINVILRSLKALIRKIVYPSSCDQHFYLNIEIYSITSAFKNSPGGFDIDINNV